MATIHVDMQISESASKANGFDYLVDLIMMSLRDGRVGPASQSDRSVSIQQTSPGRSIDDVTAALTKLDAAIKSAVDGSNVSPHDFTCTGVRVDP